jgi:outer membrane protein OmpA-like peptidoglycan-associated protein
MAAGGGEQTALRELQKSTGAVNAKDGAAAAVHAAQPGARTDTVYFFPNVTAPMVVFSLPVVDEVGRRLKENPNLVVFIRGYSAPAGNPEGQKIVSESRARYTAGYLHDHFGIPFDRMTIEWFGAAKKPEQAGVYRDNGLSRAVELITAPRLAATAKR